jgi:KDO2-lipid IV(A) lauroyltransferase
VAKYYFLSRTLAKRRPELNWIGWRIEAGALGALVGLLRALSLERATSLAYRVLTVIGPRTSTRIRVMRNLSVAFPELAGEQRERLMREVFGYAGVALAEIAHLQQIWREREQRLEFAAAPELEFLKTKNTPAVLVTAHIGPWTLTNFSAGHYGFPLAIVYAPESNPQMRALMLRLRGELPVQLLSRDNSMRTLMAELSRGATVGLGSDVRLEGGEMIPFFGHPMETNTVPARLALRFGCELVPVRAERLPGGRFRITLCAPVRPDDPNANAATQARDMTLKLNAVFEGWICATPAEWLCLARRWPKDVERAAEAEWRG